MNENNAFYRFGFGLVAAEADMESTEVDSLHYKSACLEASDSYKHASCQAVKDIYQAEGNTSAFGYHYVDVLMREGLAGNEHAKQAQEQVMHILHDVAFEMDKEAATRVGPGAIFARLAGSLAPATTKGLLLAGGAAGAGLGSLNWYLNRHTEQDKTETEQMKAKIEAYNRISDEIEQKLQDAGVGHDPAALEDRIESDIEGANVSYSGL